MKCTQCNSCNLVKTHFPIASFGDGGAYISDKVDVYLCLECGHYEFFSLAKVADYSATKAWIENAEKELKQLKLNLAELESPDTLQSIEQEMESIQKQLQTLDITIRQKDELEQRYRELIHKPQIIKSEIGRIKSRIQRLESVLGTKKNNFNGGSF